MGTALAQDPIPRFFNEAEPEAGARRVFQLGTNDADQVESALGAGAIQGTGLKSPEQAKKHADALREAGKELKELQDKLGKATGKKAREEIIEKIEEAIDQIKGHIKEIKQKWPDPVPTQPKP